MTSPPYDRNQELRLIQHLLTRSTDIANSYHDQPLIVVLEGGAATGKTTRLRKMADRWAGTTPYSYLDVEVIEGELGEAAIVELLAAIACQLARPCEIYGSLRFDRLSIGFQAMQLELDNADPKIARSQVSAMLNNRRSLTNLRRALECAAQEALRSAPRPATIPASTMEWWVNIGVDSVASYVRNRDRLGRAQRWYRHRDRKLGLDPTSQLIDLSLTPRHPAQADMRSQADELLCDAFLADLRDNFHTGRRSDEWPFNCLVLLDNVDCDLGKSFLRQLVAVQSPHNGIGLELPDPVIVVVSSRGDLISSMTQAERATVRELVDWRDRQEPDRTSSLWLRHTLSPLAVDDVLEMLNTLPGRYRYRNMASILHHLCGGHPGGIALLCEAIKEGQPDATEPEALLDLQYKNSNVEDALAEHLLRGVHEDDLDTLITCSAARNRREGLRLLRRAADDGHNISSALLPMGLWDPETGAHTTLLRLLLLRQLARRPDHHPWSWTRAHNVLRTAFIPDGHRGNVTGWLHYTLAMGQIETVLQVLANSLSPAEVDILADQLPEEAPKWIGYFRTATLPDWLALLQDVTTAPSYARESGSTGDSTAESPRFLRPLLTGMRESFDPMCRGDRGILYSRIANGLTNLSIHISDTCDELLDLTAHYTQMAQHWRRGAYRPPSG